MSITRLVMLYLLVGAGILYLQLQHTPCRSPLVLYDGRSALTPPIDLVRLGADGEYQWQVASGVVFWLPRLLHFVVLGGMPMKAVFNATDCAPAQPGATAG